MKKPMTLQEKISGKNHEIPFPCVVGRSDDVDLIFSDSTVSHRHALIDEIDNQVLIKDLNSSNGIYVNDMRIAGKQILKPGDSVKLGEIEFVVFMGEDENFGQTVILHSLPPEANWELDHERMKLIYEITTKLSESQDLEVLEERFFFRLKELFKHDRGYLAMFMDDGSLRPILFDSSADAIPLSKSIVNRLFNNGEAFVLEDALSDSSLGDSDTIIGLNIRSVLCAPLISRNQIYGLIYLDCNVPRAYDENDLELLRTIAFILAPHIENARLWSELKDRYSRTREDLRSTQERLIEMERTAAYVRLAQAMAHEIRNPLMAMGGLVRRLARSGTESPESIKYKYIMDLVVRIESIFGEVDSFVELPPPRIKLERIDHIIQEVIESYDWESVKNVLRPVISVNTPHLKLPLDSDMFKKAVSMIFDEILLNIPEQLEFKMLIQHSDNDVEIHMGDIDDCKHFRELFDAELHNKPWSLGLFLNIAHKIISDHQGKLLVDPDSQSPIPLIIKMPRMIKAQG